MATHEVQEDRTSKHETFFLIFLWSILLMAAAVVVIFFVGGTYFKTQHSPSTGPEGNWSALNHFLFLLQSAPIVIPMAIAAGWWIQTSKIMLCIRLGAVLLLLLLYGAKYFFFLAETYPPHL